MASSIASSSSLSISTESITATLMLDACAEAAGRARGGIFFQDPEGKDGRRAINQHSRPVLLDIHNSFDMNWMKKACSFMENMRGADVLLTGWRRDGGVVTLGGPIMG